MDFAAKLGLLLMVMAVLYLLARSSADRAEAIPLFSPPPDPEPSRDPAQEEAAVRPREFAGTRIDNYGFRDTDLRTGPRDPQDFFDELLVQFYSQDTGHSWQASYTVCTPKGLASHMRRTGFSSLIVSSFVVVERYDVDLILQTILEPVEESLDPPEQPVNDRDQFPSGTLFRTR